MFTFSVNFITGCMLGIEFVPKDDEDGLSAFIVDIFFLRFGIYHEE